MEQPIFSIVVPVYNVQKYLAECLDSLLNQSFRDFEILVIDDKSTDSSLQIAKTYADAHSECIQLLQHPINKGLGGARNTGIEAAAGEYILFVDSDDYLSPNALEKLADLIGKTKADVVEFCFEYVDEDGKHLHITHCAPSIYTPEGEERSALTRTVTACNKAIRTAMLLSHNIRFPERRYYEDYWTIPKLWMIGCKTVSLDEALYSYRQRTGSIMHDTNIEKANDVLLGADGLLEFCHNSSFPESRWNELEYLLLRNLLFTYVRVNGIDPRTPMQDKIWDYWMTHLPDYANNPYLSLLDDLHRRLLELVVHKKNYVLYVSFHIRAKVVACIKGILKKIGLGKLVP